MVDVHLNWLNRFHFFILRYCDRLHDFSVTWMLYFNLFFPSTARLWNSMTAECCHLTYDRNGFRSRINRHLLSLDSFWTVFLHAVHIFFSFSFSCNSMPPSGSSALHGVNPNQKKKDSIHDALCFWKMIKWNWVHTSSAQ